VSWSTYSASSCEIVANYAVGIGRQITKSILGPGSTCDNCNRVNWDMGSEGSLCYYCKAGIFMHRKFWLYTFNDQDELISVATRDEVTEAAVHEEWRHLSKSKYDKYPQTMPSVLRDMLNDISEIA